MKTHNYIIADILSKIFLYGTPLVGLMVSIIYRNKMADVLEIIEKVDQKISKKSSVYMISYFTLIIEVVLMVSVILSLYEIVDVTWGLNPQFNFYYETFVHLIALMVDFQFINIMKIRSSWI